MWCSLKLTIEYVGEIYHHFLIVPSGRPQFLDNAQFRVRRNTQMDPNGTQMDPNGTQMDPNGNQMDPNGPKWKSNGPKWNLILHNH